MLKGSSYFARNNTPLNNFTHGKADYQLPNIAETMVYVDDGGIEYIQYVYL